MSPVIEMVGVVGDVGVGGVVVARRRVLGTYFPALLNTPNG